LYKYMLVHLFMLLLYGSATRQAIIGRRYRLPACRLRAAIGYNVARTRATRCHESRSVVGISNGLRSSLVPSFAVVPLCRITAECRFIFYATLPFGVYCLLSAESFCFSIRSLMAVNQLLVNIIKLGKYLFHIVIVVLILILTMYISLILRKYLP